MDPNNQNPQNPIPTDPNALPANTPTNNSSQAAGFSIPESQPAMPEPTSTPTFNPALDMPQVPSFGNPSTPPADNPSTDDSLNMPPAPTPDAPPTESFSTPASSMPEGTNLMPPESMPTDLSHLIVNTPSSSVGPSENSAATAPQVATVPQDGNGGVQAVTSGESAGFPKVLLIIGAIILLLIVTGTSAYFILGIGQNNTAQTTSLPIEQPKLTTPPQLLLSPTPITATSSGATLGNLGGNTSTSSSKTNSSTGSATRAIDLLKK